jgi:hypothetical protein
MTKNAGPLPNYANGHVLPEYRDENLASGLYGGVVLAALLKVPAARRQDVMAEAHRRMYEHRTTWVPGRGGMVEAVSTPVPRAGAKSQGDILADILAENGWS